VVRDVAAVETSAQILGVVAAPVLVADCDAPLGVPDAERSGPRAARPAL
jgi:hypothetical protein